MFPRHLAIPTALLLMATVAQAENSPPISGSWNISSSGKAATSGELLFRVTPEDSDDPVEVTVFVLSGTNETGVASSIRRALANQLDAQRFDVAEGEGANVLLTGDPAGAGFSVELIDSDVEDVRVVVNSVAPVVPPTVPQQAEPANPPTNPQAPGNTTPGTATPPSGPGPAGLSAPPSQPSAPPAQPSAPPAQPSAPPAQPSAPPAQPSAPPAQPSAPPAQPSAPPGASSTANGGAGAPASVPPPPPGGSSG
jgi:hypothetical protein